MKLIVLSHSVSAKVIRDYKYFNHTENVNGIFLFTKKGWFSWLESMLTVVFIALTPLVWRLEVISSDYPRTGSVLNPTNTELNWKRTLTNWSSSTTSVCQRSFPDCSSIAVAGLQERDNPFTPLFVVTSVWAHQLRTRVPYVTMSYSVPLLQPYTPCFKKRPTFGLL